MIKSVALRVCACLMVSLSVLSLNAQEIRVKSFQKLEKDLFARTNPRLDLNDNPCTVIRFITPGKGLQFEGNVIGDPLYFAGETLIYMTKGSKRVTIKHPDYGVLRYEFPEKLDRQSVYEIPLKLIESPDNRTRALIMGGVNVSTEFNKITPSVMLGFVKKWGAYIKGVSDFSMKAEDATFEVDNKGYYNGIPVWLNDEAKLERTALTVGGLFRPWKMLYMYMGGGYGWRNVAYEAANDDWAKNVERSYKGYEVEGGIIFRLFGFSMMVGVQTNQFKYMELSGGVGFIF